MDSDVSTSRAFELSAEMVESLRTSRVASQPVLSCGALLEWLIAITRDVLSPTDRSSSAPALPVRLSHVVWSPAEEPAAAERLFCIVRGGFALVRPSRDGAGFLLQARVEPNARFVPPPASPVPCGESIAADVWYARLAAAGVDVSPAARGVASVVQAEEAATAVLRAQADDQSSGFILGPDAVDAALHLAFDYATRATKRGAPPTSLCPWPSVERICVSGRAGVVRTVTVSSRARRSEAPELDVSFFDRDGSALARFERVTFVERGELAAWERASVVRALEQIVRLCLPPKEFDETTEFPALGATSLDLVRIGAQACELLGWTPPLAAALATPSLAGLADAYLARERRPQPRELLATSDALSPTERQLWFLECHTNAAGAYNEGCAFRVRGALSIDALDRALGHLQRNHPALRSYFPAHDGLPQRRLDWRECQLELIETDPTYRDSPELLRQLIEEEICRPFDLERAPPFRCALLLHAAGDATLVVSAHHIVCDAWSFVRVLVPELSAAYRAALEGAVPPSLATSEIERRELGTDYEARAADFFRQKLTGVPHLLDFPFDHPRPAIQTHRGDCVRKPLPAARWQAFKTLAAELAHSPFVVGLAAYAILLQRYARSDDLCVGVPVSLRTGASDAHAFGCFVNVSVMRVQLNPLTDFAALCRSVKGALVELLPFDRLALGDVVRAAAPARSLGHTPLVQVVFGIRELGGARLDLGGVPASPVFVHNRRAKFDLSLTLDDYGDDAVLNLEYASDLLERDSATRILDQFEALLDDLTRKPNEPLCALPLATRTERQQIASYERGPLRFVIAREFGLALLGHRPDDALALRTRTSHWSVGQLRARVRQITTELEAAGIRRGDLVAIRGPRSAAWVAAVLAILDVGAAYLPLDPALPSARVERVIADARVQVVLAFDEAFGTEADSPPRVVGRRTARRSHEHGAVAEHSHDPIYGILTSGSTGTPRIARVSRAGFANLLAFYLDALQLRASDRVLFATSVGFDLSQKNVFAALIAGAELIIDDAEDFDPERILSAIERHSISVLNCTPTLAYALVARAARDLRRLRTLRVLVLGGEPIDPERFRAWTQHPSCDVRILNTYGPTECTDVVTWATLPRDADRDAGLNLGRPIQNARCRVVDAAGAIAGIGVPGELWLAGAPLGLGYLGNAPDIEAKFVRDHGTRWYRTGDLVRWTAAGELHFLGRVDQQVKFRGYRIELTEIEAVLERQAEVASAAVVVRRDAAGNASLVGYVVPSATQQRVSGMPAELRRRLATHLPTYMVPSAIVSIDRLPRTSTGKLDRSALPALPAAYHDAAVAVAVTAESVLDRVAAAIREVLGLASVAIEANFFDIGGHSLAAAQLADKLETDFGVPISVAAIVERPQLLDFAVWLAEILDRTADNDGHSLRVHGSRLPAT